MWDLISFEHIILSKWRIFVFVCIKGTSTDAEKISDLVTVGELTEYETDVWQFPDKSSCPLRSCHLTFDTRDLAIKHYTATHAQHTVLCKICKSPLMLLLGPHHLVSHYKRKHPNVEPQPKVKKIQVNTTIYCAFLSRFPFR